MNDPHPNPERFREFAAQHPELCESDRRHFAEPHISAAQHSLRRRVALGRTVCGKARIYLDLKYWIYCRDACFGRPQKPVHTEIWNELERLATAGLLVCPISYPVLIEVCKQQVPEARERISHVIDRLSGGVALQLQERLFEIELFHFHESICKGPSPLHPLGHLVFTFPGFVLGEPVPHSGAFSEATNVALQKALFDQMAAVPFSYIIDQFGGETAVEAWKRDGPFADWMTTQMKAYSHEITSFETAYAIEVAGFLDVLRPTIGSLLDHVASKAPATVAGPMSESDRAEVAAAFARILHSAATHKKLVARFPGLHIGCSIQAAIRHRRQNYRTGDRWDHMHAHPAVAYCSAFFTERSLGNLLTQRPLCFDREYGCTVLWDDDKILEYLKRVPCVGPRNDPRGSRDVNREAEFGAHGDPETA